MGNSPIREGLYVWDSPWAPAGALTDTSPGSPEREFLDRLTDPSGNYHITPFEIDSGYQKSCGVWNYDEARNSIYRFSEAVEFIEQSPNGWNEFRPLFDEAGILDPLDPRDIPESVKDRMIEIEKRVERDIGLTPKDKDYCDRFVPKFYEYGLRSFSDGGLCFGYGLDDLILRPSITVSTSGEAFKQCADTGINNGQCQVSTVKVFSAFEYVSPQCHVIATNVPYYKGFDKAHVFAEYKGVALDPSNIGRSADSENILLTSRQLMSVYHFNLGVVLEKKGELIGAESEYRRVIQLRDDIPEAHNNLGVVLEKKGDLIGAESEYRRAIQLRDDIPEAHNNLGIILKANGKNDEAERHFRRYKELTGKK